MNQAPHQVARIGHHKRAKLCAWSNLGADDLGASPSKVPGNQRRHSRGSLPTLRRPNGFGRQHEKELSQATKRFESRNPRSFRPSLKSILAAKFRTHFGRSLETFSSANLELPSAELRKSSLGIRGSNHLWLPVRGLVPASPPSSVTRVWGEASSQFRAVSAWTRSRYTLRGSWGSRGYSS